MAKGFAERLLRLEQHHRDALGDGCGTCRAWSHTVYRFTDREDPPPFCPQCGRPRPETYLVREYGLPDDFDAQVPNGQEGRS